jgi:putative ABC transport system permease protein
VRGFFADCIHAVRHYLATPVSSIIAVLMLAVAMAVLTAFLALWTELSLTPHRGFERGAGLVTVGVNDGTGTMPLELLERINEEATTIEAIAGVASSGRLIQRNGEFIFVPAELVTARFFPDIRPRIQLGRTFDAADHATDAEPVVIISDALWRRWYDGRPEVLGESMRVRDPNIPDRGADGAASEPDGVHDYRIVGVLTPGMSGTFFPPNMELWMPFEPMFDRLLAALGPDAHRALHTQAVARPARGASERAIRNELRGRYAETEVLATVNPGPDPQIDAMAGIVVSFDRQRDVQRQLHLFIAGSALLALVAGFNVSLFLLSRAPGRRRELAIRMAVGAPFGRLARQLATEAGLLVAAATALGLLLSLWLTVLTSDLAFLRQLPRIETTPLGWRVLVLVAGTTLLLTMLVSLAPVVGLKRLGIAAGSRSVTARASLTQRLAGTVQVSVATMVGGVAVALVWQIGVLEAFDPGFSASDVRVVTAGPEARAGPDASEDAILLEREHRRAVLAALAGVDAVGFGTAIPGRPRSRDWLQVAPPDDPQSPIAVHAESVDPNYMPLLGATLLNGRLLDGADRDSVLINETLARRLWGRVDVAGELLPLASPSAAGSGEVAGVVRDIVYGHPSEGVDPTVYLPLSALTPSERILVRTSRSSAELRGLLEERIDEDNLAWNVGLIGSVDDWWNETMAPDRARAGLTVASALFVLGLAGFGSYGTQRYLVRAGRREYAILGAVGAGPRRLGRLVLVRGLWFGVPGMLLGGLLAFIAVAWMRGEFVDQAVLPAVVTMLALSGIAALLVLAALGPAHDARRTEAAAWLNAE